MVDDWQKMDDGRVVRLELVPRASAGCPGPGAVHMNAVVANVPSCEAGVGRQSLSELPGMCLYMS